MDGKDGLMDGWMDGRMDGWMARRGDGRSSGRSSAYAPRPLSHRWPRHTPPQPPQTPARTPAAAAPWPTPASTARTGEGRWSLSCRGVVGSFTLLRRCCVAPRAKNNWCGQVLPCQAAHPMPACCAGTR
eukprot:309801-Chlamydomonas_euryale.AAC.1